MGEEWITFRCRVSTDGRITLPSEIRESEGIEKGDFVDVKVKKVGSDE